MIGAIAGDIIGSIYEHDNIKTKEFPLFGPHPRTNLNHTRNGRSLRDCFFTDDTVLTIAVADWLLGGEDNLVDRLIHYTFKYNNRGYGGMYMKWANSHNPQPYDSYGNGSAMRVSPVGWLAKDMEQVLRLAKASAEVTHNHPEGIKGAQATAMAIWLAREGTMGPQIRQAITTFAEYDLSESVDEIREWYSFDPSCQGTVPQAIVCALEAANFEDAIRNAVSIGGDSDTVAAITGSIAEAMFGMPDELVVHVRSYLSGDMIGVLDRFAVCVEVNA
ncbi:MAG: ADP-ribosylglycohydrolase family protein [Rhodospirillaceae bacterium]|nr:ADP-ribosylglycohydrolase family protein [Rhodospirillaceae bacterium]